MSTIPEPTRPGYGVTFEQIELGDELPIEHPDVSLPRIKLWCDAADQHFPRFLDHEARQLAEVGRVGVGEARQREGVALLVRQRVSTAP